jgi:hypothetical protein
VKDEKAYSSFVSFPPNPVSFFGVDAVSAHTELGAWMYTNPLCYRLSHDTRAVRPSNPSAFGWKMGAYTLSLQGRPNGNPLQVQNDTGSTLETHGSYQRGYSVTYPGVNSMLTLNTYKTHITKHTFLLSSESTQRFCFRVHIRSATREQLESTRWKPTRLLRAANWSS